ncbi:zinc ribbon-containing protein [Thiohalobacter sp. IOR34]|uniref:zinc ribbon-containing protein n=1 Tax=Thiohalobacter sp. IOR34 TaxID=3057176 RepID=UPI0025B1CB7D|nr:zinc ribbon-containing protein [Thiohalobacter sp. IOR34]WJW74884.1 zinc ribbon-containing protein [Thiohalobacter sp. IOR34]
MTDQPENSPGERLVQAYNRMMERLRAAIEEAEEKAIPTLEENLHAAQDKAVELGELSREEAERIATWLRRDLEAAGDFLARSGSELAAWLRFDVERVEERLLEMLFTVADRTRLELQRFEDRMQANAAYHTGEVTGPGVLRCVACGEELHFHHTGHIPPCPKCRGTEFRRAGEA